MYSRFARHAPGPGVKFDKIGYVADARRFNRGSAYELKMSCHSVGSAHRRGPCQEVVCDGGDGCDGVWPRRVSAVGTRHVKMQDKADAGRPCPSNGQLKGANPAL